MSNFVESKVERGQPKNAGQFRTPSKSDPESVLPARAPESRLALMGGIHQVTENERNTAPTGKLNSLPTASQKAARAAMAQLQAWQHHQIGTTGRARYDVIDNYADTSIVYGSSEYSDIDPLSHVMRAELTKDGTLLNLHVGNRDPYGIIWYAESDTEPSGWARLR